MKHEGMVRKKTYNVTVIPFGIRQAVNMGKYDWINLNIHEDNFDIEPGNSVISIIEFKRLISTEDAIKAIEELNMRPANIGELLGLGSEYPELQNAFPIVALGSTLKDKQEEMMNVNPFTGAEVNDQDMVACIQKKEGCRRLNLHFTHGLWNEDVRFAAVAKE